MDEGGVSVEADSRFTGNYFIRVLFDRK